MLSFKFILENHQADTLNIVLGTIPDEFKEQVNEWIGEIDTTIEYIQETVKYVFSKAPKNNRKEYALWCKDNAPYLLPYMFAYLDEKDLLPIIYKNAFKNKGE